MKNKVLVLAIMIVSIGLFSLPVDAAFTTGTGRHTFKINNFRVTPQVQLRSFLIGFGLNEQSAFNIQITEASEDGDTEKPEMNFIIPSYEGIDDSRYQFSLRGPVVDLGYQYIPKHPFFVTPNSLNALEVGLKRYTGEVYDTQADDNTVVQTVDKTYFVMGLLSRSRWDNYNLFSDFKFSYDLEEV
ncbi:MAG: hypothetical protein ACOCV8_05185, partial [Spirochaetota bacterium]